MTAGDGQSKKCWQSSRDSTEQPCGSGLLRKLGRISSGCWQIVYGLCIAAWLPGLILVSSVIWRHSCWEIESWLLCCIHRASWTLCCLLFPAAVSTFLVDQTYASQIIKKDITKELSVADATFQSEKESEVALRLSSTSGCQAAGKLNVRGWPGGDGNSEFQPKALGSQGRMENQVQEQEWCFHGMIPAKGQRA